MAPIFWVSLFRAWNLYRCFIDFGMDFGVTVDVFWYLYRSHMQHFKPWKTFVFTMNFNDFTIQKHDFWWCSWSFSLKFWHWFLMSLGIVFSSILEPLWHQVPCFGVIVFGMIFRFHFWCKMVSKMVRGNVGQSNIFAFFSILFSKIDYWTSVYLSIQSRCNFFLAHAVGHTF